MRLSVQQWLFIGNSDVVLLKRYIRMLLRLNFSIVRDLIIVNIDCTLYIGAFN